MAAPLQDFAKVMRLLFRCLRYASLLIIVVVAVVIGRELHSGFAYFADIHPVLGWLFLVVALAAIGWLVGRPAVRFWRVPAALVQPRLRGRLEDLDAAEAAARLAFVGRYLKTLARNPALAGQAAAIEGARERCEALRESVRSGAEGDAAACRAALQRFENEVVEPILAPLDEQANQVIRAEALAVGLSTAVSWNGTVDALIVLWRNANLVARVATIYYGRPGVRGSLLILRDVATGMFVASQMQGLLESASGLFGKWFGAAGSVFAGPATDGAVNALVTLRIGYVAKARCRAFRPWNDATIARFLGGAMKEVSAQGAGVVKDIIGAAVKSGVVKLPVELVKKTGNLLGGILGKLQGDRQPQTG